jgi:hypothetical protein
MPVYRDAPNGEGGLMRKLVVTENITLDGVIDMSGGWFDPLNPEHAVSA